MKHLKLHAFDDTPLPYKVTSTGAIFIIYIFGLMILSDCMSIFSQRGRKSPYVAMWSLNRPTFTLSLRNVVAFSMLWVPDLLWGILCASEASPRPLEIPPSWPHQISNWNSGVFRFEMSDSESKISIFCLGILEQGRQALFPGILHSYGMCKTGNKKQQETNLCGHVPSFSVTV